MLLGPRDQTLGPDFSPRAHKDMEGEEWFHKIPIYLHMHVQHTAHTHTPYTQTVINICTQH